MFRSLPARAGSVGALEWNAKELPTDHQPNTIKPESAVLPFIILLPGTLSPCQLLLLQELLVYG